MKKKCNKGELLNDYTPFSAKSDKTVAGRARRITYPLPSRGKSPSSKALPFGVCAIATAHSTASPTLVQPRMACYRIRVIKWLPEFTSETFLQISLNFSCKSTDILKFLLYLPLDITRKTFTTPSFGFFHQQYSNGLQLHLRQNHSVQN